MTQPTQQQPPQFSLQTQQAIAKISLRMDDLAQTISIAFNMLAAEKDQKIKELEAKLTELQAPVKSADKE
ncbi:MAG: hypothetical protein FWC33_02780 [Candidatus Bathyarchaeota archaeon]|nr:hypothetical protein [Candidatus Termiticorpusculum sp.]